jgi:hypothetical protein
MASTTSHPTMTRDATAPAAILAISFDVYGLSMMTCMRVGPNTHEAPRRGRQPRRSYFLGRRPKTIHGTGKSGKSRAPKRNQVRSDRPLWAAYFAVKRPDGIAARTATAMKTIQGNMGRSSGSKQYPD